MANDAGKQVIFLTEAFFFFATISAVTLHYNIHSIFRIAFSIGPDFNRAVNQD